MTFSKDSLDQIEDASNKAGFTMNYLEDDGTNSRPSFEFKICSPAGQDFREETYADDLENLIGNLSFIHRNFDCSEEAYIWLDDTGHGKNGAPHDMKDLYEDMEACKELLGNLADELRKIEREL